MLHDLAWLIRFEEHGDILSLPSRDCLSRLWIEGCRPYKRVNLQIGFASMGWTSGVKIDLLDDLFAAIP